MAANKKLTHDEVYKRVKSIENGEYTLISEFTKTKEPITVKHKCGKEIVCARAQGFLNEGKNRCLCNKVVVKRSTTPITETEFLKRLKNQTDSSEYKYIDGFKNTKTKFRVKHLICENVFSVTPDMFLGKKQSRCPECSGTKRGSHLKQDNSYLDKILANLEHGHEYVWLDEYKGNNKYMHRIKHTCDHIYKVRPNDVQQGYKCPECSDAYNSYPVRAITEFLNASNITYEKEVTAEGLGSKRFDFVIESERGDLILEYDGIQHFEASGFITIKKVQDTHKRDILKNEWCKENEYELLRIPSSVPLTDINEIISIYINSPIELKTLKNILYIDKSGQIHNHDLYYTLLTVNLQSRQ